MFGDLSFKLSAAAAEVMAPPVEIEALSIGCWFPDLLTASMNGEFVNLESHATCIDSEQLASKSPKVHWLISGSTVHYMAWQMLLCFAMQPLGPAIRALQKIIPLTYKMVRHFLGLICMVLYAFIQFSSKNSSYNLFTWNYKRRIIQPSILHSLIQHFDQPIEW